MPAFPRRPIPLAAASAAARAFACSGSPASRPSSSTTSCHAFVASSTFSEKRWVSCASSALDRLEARRCSARQVGARLAELGEGLRDEARAHRGQSRGRGRFRERPEPRPERRPEGDAGEKRGDLRQGPVVRLAQLGRVRHGLQVRDPAPGAVQARRWPRPGRGRCSRRSGAPLRPSIAAQRGLGAASAASIAGSTSVGL